MEKEGNELKSPLHLKLEWNKRESEKVKRNASILQTPTHSHAANFISSGPIDFLTLEI